MEKLNKAEQLALGNKVKEWKTQGGFKVWGDIPGTTLEMRLERKPGLEGYVLGILGFIQMSIGNDPIQGTCCGVVYERFLKCVGKYFGQDSEVRALYRKALHEATKKYEEKKEKSCEKLQRPIKELIQSARDAL